MDKTWKQDKYTMQIKNFRIFILSGTVKFTVNKELESEDGM